MNRRNEFYGHSGNNGNTTNNQQPDRYPQQEWSDDDYRGGNRYRANQPYAGSDEQSEFQRAGRYASNARQGYGDYEPSQRGGSYYGGAQDARASQDYGYTDSPNFGANRGGWSGESQLGGYSQSGSYQPSGGYSQPGTYAQSQRGMQGQSGNYAQDMRGNHAQSGNYAQDMRGGQRLQDNGYLQQGQSRQPRDYPQSSGGYADYGTRSMTGSQLGQSRSDFNQAGGYGSGYSQTGSRNESQSQRGFSGKGPKGYARSDERLKEDICERLTDDYAIDASDIDITVRNGTVTLSGTVDERWMKHHVEDLVDRCSGVQDIENRLAVSRARGASQSQSSPSSPSSTSGTASTTASSSTRKQ